MNVKLPLAVLAATLAGAPAAMAQSYQNNAPQIPYERSSPSGLPTTSPQVESLPGEQPNPWDTPTRNQMPDRATSGSTGAYGTPGTYGSTRSTGSMSNSMPSSGAMGSTGSAAGTMQGNRQVIMQVDPSMLPRNVPGNSRTSLMQTALLNYFSAAGFTSVRDFRRDGKNYLAEAQSPDGTWNTVLLDANNGTISKIR